MFSNNLKKRIEELENQVWELKHPFKLKIGDKIKAYCYSEENKNKIICKGLVIVSARVYKHSRSEYSGRFWSESHYECIFEGQIVIASDYKDGIFLESLKY